MKTIKFEDADIVASDEYQIVGEYSALSIHIPDYQLRKTTSLELESYDSINGENLLT